MTIFQNLGMEPQLAQHVMSFVQATSHISAIPPGVIGATTCKYMVGTSEIIGKVKLRDGARGAALEAEFKARVVNADLSERQRNVACLKFFNTRLVPITYDWTDQRLRVLSVNGI